jgi:hypothetical protein
MTTTTAQINAYPDIAPPTGAGERFEDHGTWEPDDPPRQPYRVVYGKTRTIGSAIGWRGEVRRR